MPGADKTVLITGARAPVALHLARLLHGAGRRVILADAPARPIAATSKACARYHRLPPPRFEPRAYAEAVEALVRAEGIDLVIPTCEEVFHLAMAWRGRAMPARLFAPGIELLAEVHNKHAFIRLAERLGLAVPETVLLQSTADLEAVRGRSRELVFKPVWSRFASHVLLRPTPDFLDAIAPSPAMPWVAQRFVDGDEISAYAVAREGRLKALALYRSLYRAGKGAGIFFERVEDQAARELVERIVTATGWTGQISFDLMREEDGRVLPLECNPRAVSGLHFFRDTARFADAVLGDGPEVIPDVIAPQTVRLAMWIYGLPAALRSGGLGGFRKAMRDGQELLDWPGDPAPVKAQWPALAEIAGVAWRQGISLQAAATRDIEWNGPSDRS
ncbi:MULTISPECIES: ATP-grasp domain-containing protein [unclassified Mesorhizobium]|uniref:ATP-grasp domain-containing protein n=1 Tax=unclassified Mesorhizobium TaxID=325217 RepID=UPI000F74F18E|nr:MULTISPECIES: ATP-grasp domain-containing protein [unclassified Mesorhizobium]AZO70623.1 ATP-grasp domain-containing protein [Mesorhizobium sp. M1D.F.Ca.ET.043.01.1.1]RWA91890.1 MAG: ATP-grasp domain-containing protein [Mesorhizobium sp.]